jgi:hypothetical protein
MADPVPIYQHQTEHGADGACLDLDSTGHGPWGPGVPLCYAYAAPRETKSRGRSDKPKYDRQTTLPDPPTSYYDDTDGTVPVYRQKSGEKGNLYSVSSPPGGHRDEVVFHAYDAQTPGTVPIYSQPSSATAKKGPPDRYHYQAGPTGGSLAGTVAFYALPIGYRVGDKSAEIRGPDQQNNVAELSSVLDGQSWVLIDVCAQWCGPCQAMAREITAFLDKVNTQGLPLKLLTVITDDANGRPSGQKTAQQWADRFELKDSIIHCAGDPSSDLRQLVPRYARANGSSTPGYPTSVVVDPTGVVRHYQLGFDLNSLESALNVLATSV